MPELTNKSGGTFLTEVLMEDCQDGIAVTDSDFVLAACNESFCRMMNKENFDCIAGKSLFEILPCGALRHLLFKTVENRLPVSCKVSFDKTEKTVKFIFTPLIRKEKFSGILAVLKDISEEIAVKNEKDTFVEALTHDLKNFVQALTKSIGLLSGGILGKLNPEQQKIGDMIYESCSQMQEMLYNSMRVCRYDDEMCRLNKVHFDIENLVKLCINEVKALAFEKSIGIDLNSNLQDCEREIFADKVQIRSVISNFLNNGINYALKNTDILISLTKNDNRFILSCENFCNQIPDSIKEHIFDKYVSASETGSKTGSGLGLYLCKRIIDAHNGEIYLTSDKNKTKLTFEISV